MAGGAWAARGACAIEDGPAGTVGDLVDVSGWSAAEVAESLDTSVAAVHTTRRSGRAPRFTAAVSPWHSRCRRCRRKLPVAGSYNSALDKIFVSPLFPPVIRTRPSVSRVAAWKRRARVISAAGVNVPGD